MISHDYDSTNRQKMKDGLLILLGTLSIMALLGVFG